MQILHIKTVNTITRLTDMETDDADKCKECGEMLADDDFDIAYEDRGVPGYTEPVCYGYKCHNCGHKEEY